MAKFNDYGFQADGRGSLLITEGRVRALSLESAWHKAIALSFEACEEGTGIRPETISVWRIASPSEHHG